MTSVVSSGGQRWLPAAEGKAGGRSAPGISLSDKWLLAAAVPAVCALEALAQGSLWRHYAPLPAVNLITSATFLVTGILIRREDGQRGTSWALILAGAAHPLGWLNAWEAGPFPLYASVFGYLDVIFGAWALLRYPAPALGRPQRYFLAVLTCWLIGGPAFLAVISRPNWQGFRATIWWPGLLANEPIYNDASLIFYVGAIALALVFLGLLLGRFIEARGLDRMFITPILVAAVVSTVAAAAVLTRTFIAGPSDDLSTIEGLAELSVPLAFLISVIQRRMARGGVADLAVRVASPAQPDAVRRELRRVLHDPQLDVCYWVPASMRYVDADGHPADLGQLRAGRLEIPVTGSDGRTKLAVILIDPSAGRDQLLLEGALSASRMALENERLQADLRTQLAETRESRARLLEHGLAERRALERNLHDGAQARLVGLAARLAAIRAGTADAAVTSALDHAGRELLLALGQLRDLARGILPGILSQSGIGPAVEVVVEGLPIQVSLNMTARRYRPAIEATTYFVICEALANTVKHAGCRSADVRVWEANQILHVRVQDQGRGGAQPGSPGLAALADRVEAVGGDISIDSPPGVGTTLRARIPCA
jgi:signal transduction histidine kinase